MRRALTGEVGLVAGARQGPAAVWLGIRMLAWRLVLPSLKRVLSLSALARLMWPRGRRCERSVARERWIMGGIRRLYLGSDHRSSDNCLERSLLAYRYFAQAGADPRLTWGVRKEGGKVVGHAWVILDGGLILRERVDSYLPMAVFGSNGRPVEQSGPTRNR